MAWPKGRPRQAKVARPAASAEAVEMTASDAPPVELAPEPDKPTLPPGALYALANALVGNPAVDAAYRARLDELRDAWAATDLLETDKREGLYLEMRATKTLWGKLSRMSAKEGLRALQREQHPNVKVVGY